MPKAAAVKKQAAKPAAPKNLPAVDIAGAAPLPTLSTAPRSAPFACLVPSPLNPRKRLDKSREALLPLAQSIAAKGVLENLLVRPLRAEDKHGDAVYEIIAGERRWRATGLAAGEGLIPADTEVPIRIIDPCTDAELVELAGVENMARADMDPLDEADLIAAMRVYHPDDAAIMQRLGIPERTFYRRVALLRLATELQQALRDGAISNAQAAAFARGDVKAQRAHYKAMVAQPTYEGRIDRIEQAMLRKRIPVGKQIFDLADYTGEIVADPEDGKRYFADTAAFKKLQDKVVDTKVESLAKKWPWAKRIADTKTWDYVDAKKDNKKAGAVVYLDHAGKLKVKAPVVERPPQQRNANAGRAGSEESYEVHKARIDRLRQPYIAALAGDAHATLAVWIITTLENVRIDDDSSFTLRALAPLRERLVAALAFEAPPEDAELLGVLTSPDDSQVGDIYRALRASPIDHVLAFFAAIAAPQFDNDLVDWQGTIGPLAEAIIPTVAAAEAAQ